MNQFAVLFLLITALAMAALPRRWAPLSLVVGTCYITNAQVIPIGPFNFTALRVLLFIGFIRSIVRKESLPGGLNGMDKLLLTLCAWLLISSVFHEPFGEALVFRMGLFYNILGTYFLIRIFCQTHADLPQLISIIAFTLTPVALEMIFEKAFHKNIFAYIGDLPLDVLARDGKFRAQGPFGHPILAGTVGGLCLPFMLGIWKLRALAAKLGLVACLTMVWASASSGPVLTVLISLFAVALWPWRQLTRKLRFAVILFLVVCEVTMTRHAYYLIEKIDLTGSSTGYHRAAIIDAARKHVGEWWVGGTDYTRHWMPYGTNWNPNHVDITNQYLLYGVDGGLPLMLLFIGLLWLAFRYIGDFLKHCVTAPDSDLFLIWCVGAALFSSAATMLSVAYFDQSGSFLYFKLAIIASIHASVPARN